MVHLAAGTSPPEPESETLSMRIKANLPQWDFGAAEAAAEISRISHAPTVLCRDPDPVRHGLALIADACESMVDLNLVAADWNIAGSGMTLRDSTPPDVCAPMVLLWGMRTVFQAKLSMTRTHFPSLMSFHDGTATTDS